MVLLHWQMTYGPPVTALIDLVKKLLLRCGPCQLPRIPAAAGMALQAGGGGAFWASALGGEQDAC